MKSKKNTLEAMKTPLIQISFATLLFFSCNAGKGKVSNKECVDNNIPGYNPNAISVNTIAPDKGLADPHVMIVGDTLFVMCGHDKSWDSQQCCPMDRWELWSTTNLIDWEHRLNILPIQTYIGDQNNCWAGDLATKDGKYYWYFSNRDFNTGVMVAPTMTGPWKDALDEPLIPKGLAKTKSYDPEVFEENGKHYIIWGAWEYYIAELGEDMISLASEPELIEIKNEDGSFKGAADKPSLFKRGDWYYLWWGEVYSMSKNIKGPYSYKGDYIHAAHGSVFQWDDQWYSIQENHETNALFRGVQLRPLYFNDDSTVYIPEDNWEYPLPGRTYNFEHSTQGWKNHKHEDVNRNADEQYIYGKTESAEDYISSLPLLDSPIYLCDNIKITIKNISGADSIKVSLNKFERNSSWWKEVEREIDWTNESWVAAELKPTENWQEVTIPLSKFGEDEKYLNAIGIQPTAGIEHADWIIKSVVIE